MMSKFSTITAVLLACSVVGAINVGFKKPAAAFNGLNKYLIDKVPETAPLGDNLEHLEANIEHLEDERLRKAAQLVLDLSKLDKDCSPEAMSVLVALGEARVKPYGGKRVEKVLREAGLEVIVDKCVTKVSRLPKELLSQSDHREFIQAFQAPVKYYEPRPYEVITNIGDKDKVKRVTHDWIIRGLINSADENSQFIKKSHNPSTGEEVILRDADKFNYALDTHLLKPCEKLLADNDFNLLVDGTQAFKDLEVSHQWTDRDTKRIASLRYTCNKYLAMNPEDKAKMLRNYGRMNLSFFNPLLSKYTS